MTKRMEIRTSNATINRSTQTPPKLLFLIPCLILLGLSAVAGIKRVDDKESLRGLKGAYLITSFQDQQPQGLTTNALLKAARTTLEAAAIPVDSEPEKAHGEANLSITVAAIYDSQTGLYLFTVQVALIQDAQLTRQSHPAAVVAQTWTRTVQGLTTPERLDAIEEALKRCIDKFVADYRAVNPKQ